jgi:nucleoside-diphosphate-sugar epimerase
MKTLLVTGATGYIGSHFIKKYSNSYAITPVSLRSQKVSDIDFSNIDTVIHLSALVHKQKSPQPQDYFQINTEQSIALATSAKANGVKHFIFFSTVAVYGRNGDLDQKLSVLINEESECVPIEPYGESKLMAEKHIAALEDDRFMVSIIRPPIVYGSNCPGNMASLMRLIKLFPVLPFKYSGNKRSMVFIDNLLHFMQLVIEKQVNGITIPQDMEALSIQEIVKALARGLKKQVFLYKLPDPIFRYLCDRKKKVMSSLYGTLVFDSTLSNTRLGFTAPYSTEEGLLLMCDPTKHKT